MSTFIVYFLSSIRRLFFLSFSLSCAFSFAEVTSEAAHGSSVEAVQAVVVVAESESKPIQVGITTQSTVAATDESPYYLRAMKKTNNVDAKPIVLSVFLLALLLVIGWWRLQKNGGFIGLQKKVQGLSDNPIQLIAHKRLSTTTQIFYIEVNGREFLVAENKNSNAITLVATVNQQVDAAAAEIQQKII